MNDKSVSFEYVGSAYRQAKDNKSPWLVSFVATAEEISSWAGIARRSEKGLIGFQRPDDPLRVERTREFFSHHLNQSPTALIVGVHTPPNEQLRRVTLEFTDDNSPEAQAATIRPCRVRIKHDPSGMSLKEAVNEIKAQIGSRLKGDLEGDEDPEEDAEEDSGTEEDETDDLVGDEEQEIELGRSLLLDLRKHLEDSEWCKQNESDLADIAKPCTVIDGQHRLKGAVLCERDIPFSVCAIFDCDWPEQVFQFTVVNYTAKGIPDQFITANAALSLTKNELGALKDRLSQAKIKVTEYELMKIVNFDSESPFFQKVSMASTTNSPDKIGYKTMVKVAKTWHDGKHNAVKPIIANIYPDIVGKASAVKRDRLEKWKQDDWGQFFLDFWQTIFDHYKHEKAADGSSLWSVGSNLLLAATLLELQNVFLTNLAQQDEEFFLPKESNKLAIDELREKIRSRAKKVASWIPPDFFARDWKMKSLNTGAGKAAIQQALKSFVENKGSYQYANSSIITGKTN